MAIFPYIDVPFTSINLYQRPVSARWGEKKKLFDLCRTELKREPEINEIFAFYNSTRDFLRILWRDGHGSQEIARALPRGGFILPAPQPGDAFVKIEREKLNNLFRMPKNVSWRSPVSPSAPEGGASPRDSQNPPSSNTFIEIDSDLLRALLKPVRSPLPVRSSRSPKPKKTGLKASDVLPFPSGRISSARRGKRKRKK